MGSSKLYMLLLGASVPGRNTEQHDIFFGIGNNLAELVPGILGFWPAPAKVHVDGWREVRQVNGFDITVLPRTSINDEPLHHLFFLNLGGYKKGEFEEFHYKTLSVASTQADAVKQAMQSAFYKHTGFPGAPSHLDDKYGVDVDDMFKVVDILPASVKEKYSIRITEAKTITEDQIHLGYFTLSKLQSYTNK